jgi:hypothetical protein
MKFRTGKYKGLDLDVVKRRDPRYVEWVRENRPEMLRATPTQNHIKHLRRKEYM